MDYLELWLERFPCVLVEACARVCLDRLADCLAERVHVVATRDAEHAHVAGKQPGERQVVDGRKQLSRRQVPAGAEDDQRSGIGEPLLDVLGERVRCARRGHAHAGSVSRRGGTRVSSPSASSRPARRAAPRTPASLPWRARRISVRSPTPGRANRRATSTAGAEQQLPGARDAAPHRDHVGIEGVERVGDPDPQTLPQRAHRLDRLGIAGLSRLHGVAPIDRPPPSLQLPQRRGGTVGCDLRRQVVQDPAGGQRLERAPLRKLERRWNALAEIDAHQSVAELPGRPGRPPIDLPAQYQPAADPGPHREHDQVLDHRPAPFVESLGERRHGCVVVDEHRQAQTIPECATEVEVGEVEIDAGAHPTGGELDHRRHPNPDSRRTSIAHLFDAGDDLLHQPLGARIVGGPNKRVAEPGILQRRDGHLRAAHVDADQLAIEHGRQSTCHARPWRA